MKQIGLLLTGGLVILIVVLVGVFNAFTRHQPSQSVIVVPVDPTITYLETVLSEQETAYRVQVTRLEETLQQQQVDVPDQLEALNSQITASQQALDDLLDRQQTLQSQLAQLKAARTEQLATQQTKLEQVRHQYTARQTELQAARAQLVEVNAQLGR